MAKELLVENAHEIGKKFFAKHLAGLVEIRAEATIVEALRRYLQGADFSKANLEEAIVECKRQLDDMDGSQNLPTRRKVQNRYRYIDI